MTNTNQIPTWFWIVSGLALVWNLMGVGAYFIQMNMSDDVMALLPEAERALYDNFPIWANIAFAIAVFGGTIGCIGLLMKKSWAKPILILKCHWRDRPNGLQCYWRRYGCLWA